MFGDAGTTLFETPGLVPEGTAFLDAIKVVLLTAPGTCCTTIH